MKLSTSRRAETLDAGSGVHDDEDNDRDDVSTQRPQHGHPTSHEHLVIVRDVIASSTAAAGAAIAGGESTLRHTYARFIINIGKVHTFVCVSLLSLVYNGDYSTKMTIVVMSVCPSVIRCYVKTEQGKMHQLVLNIASCYRYIITPNNSNALKISVLDNLTNSSVS